MGDDNKQPQPSCGNCELQTICLTEHAHRKAGEELWRITGDSGETMDLAFDVFRLLASRCKHYKGYGVEVRKGTGEGL